MNTPPCHFATRFPSVMLLTLVLCSLTANRVRANDVSPVNFTRDVRPILSNYCFKCHGPDEQTREADLRLDTFDGATADLGGYQAVKPGDHAASEAIVRMLETDADLKMPPPDSGLKLDASQIETLKRWIAEGAQYERHWSFEPVKRPDIPEIAAADSGQPLHPIDAFVQKRLESTGLKPSPLADRHTLIRRVYLDLLGLLPPPEVVTAFVNDSEPDAYERMLDVALASPHFGEKWGRHWLDQARYADTNGYTVDSARTIWPYRDWVINALNEDKPFDEFTIEQLAGDLLADPTTDQLIATGFHRNTLVNQEGGTDKEQFRIEAVVDRANTTGAVWLGLTVGCAQCHTHKYDPLTHTEYFQLFAFFNSTQDVNSIGPTLPVQTAEQTARLTELATKIEQAKQNLNTYKADRSTTVDSSPAAVDWEMITPTAYTATTAQLQLLDDQSLLATGDNGKTERYTITFTPELNTITALRLETLTHESLPKNGPGRAGNGNFVLHEVTLSQGETTANWVAATADHSQSGYEIARVIDGDPKTGWAINVKKGNMNVDRTATLFAEPLKLTAGQSMTVTLEFNADNPLYNIGRFRLAATSASHAQIGLPDPELKRLEQVVQNATTARDKYRRSIPATMIMRELPQPRQTHLLIRGDFLRPADPVEPNVPAFLPPLSGSDGPADRLDLARWLVAADNPLTARVTVNRVWMQLFGQGLVETENDFGLQGTLPTHPQLLDWLAHEFAGNGWSFKQLIRTVMLSHTYQQSSVLRQEVAAVDPLNKLLARQTRIRVDAEIVRDLALSASGLLNETIGGPSVYPPQPDGVYAFTQVKSSWPTSKGANRYRRGMYTFFKRSAPHPLLTTFDTPSFNTTCTRRSRSNTPLQSLTMANDEALFEMAQGLGKLLVETPGSVDDKIQTAYLRCFSRPPVPAEVSRVKQYMQAQQAEFADNIADAKQLVGRFALDDTRLPAQAAWTMTARVLMNLDEFLTRE